MNTLSYGLLAMLAQGPCTGYELMLQIQPVWQAKHSQIYPLLAKLEQNGFVRFVEVPQKEKPDKKVYSITERGVEALKQWLPSETSEPVKRDEMLLKTYCIWLVDPSKTERLFEERLESFWKKMSKYKSMLSELHREDDNAERLPGAGSASFGQYILLKRAIDSAQMEMDWCRWVLQLLQEQREKRAAAEAAKDAAQ